jgi:isopenicillin N synthase-like dioxygenase
MQVIDYTDKNASADFFASMVEYGFGVVKNSPVNKTDIANMYASWHEFFCLSIDEKLKFEFSNKAHDGFVSTSLSETAKAHSIKDLKEFYHFYEWSRCPQNLKPITINMLQQMSVFGAELLSWLEQHAPNEVTSLFSAPLNEMIKGSELNLLRLLHYPPLDGTENVGAMRAAAHADINLITILPSPVEPGLQLLDKNNNWIDVPYHEDYIIINIGDMLQEASGQYFKSTLHRVTNPEGNAKQKARLSMPLFIHPRDEVRLSASYTAGEYRSERYAELGLEKNEG